MQLWTSIQGILIQPKKTCKLRVGDCSWLLWQRCQYANVTKWHEDGWAGLSWWLESWRFPRTFFRFQFRSKGRTLITVWCRTMSTICSPGPEPYKLEHLQHGDNELWLALQDFSRYYGFSMFPYRHKRLPTPASSFLTKSSKHLFVRHVDLNITRSHGHQPGIERMVSNFDVFCWSYRLPKYRRRTFPGEVFPPCLLRGLGLLSHRWKGHLTNMHLWGVCCCCCCCRWCCCWLLWWYGCSCRFGCGCCCGCWWCICEWHCSCCCCSWWYGCCCSAATAF